MRKLLIVGMPESGKSTYIGALRHILLAKDVETDLEITNLADSEKHLNQLEDHWLSCKPMERTKTSNEAWVQLNVRDKFTGAESSLEIPDLRGENFEHPAAGGCPRPLYEALIASDGITLFTNANRENDCLLIDDFGDMFDEDEDEKQEVEIGASGRLEEHNAAKAGSVGETRDAAAGEPRPVRFQPENMSEEVKIVEFLQLANRRPEHPRLRKLALIVSAWDLVADEQDMTPAKWLEAKRPMLNQFLANNDDLWELRIYGVSAQGGRLPERKAEFEGMMNQSKRILVVGVEAGQHDLTAPLRWLIAGG
ncbi:hypothetical protein [Novosphingobium sp. B-7]|uniref:TRAFAC clade GTPase domain-containing protein n=1 Tax=Novosphingobium sp. B-7 TaxID=1298855 RepID=UPI0003B38EC8|nr:hypothetical protein [Novosphingobium sp. B-7]